MSAVPAEPQASEPVPPTAARGEDLLGVRCGAAMIDLALLSGLFIVLSVTIGEASVGGGGFSFSLDSAAAALLFLGLALVYYFALEATVGQTVGKLLVGLRVVRADGDRPSVGAVAIRTLLRVVDWLPLLYLVGFIAMLATGVRQQRLGDLAARTGIARAVPIRHRGRAVAALVSSLVLVVAGSVVYVAATDEDEGATTYRGHGVSFDYPAGWEEGKTQTLGSNDSTNQLWKAAVTTAGDLDLVSVTAYRLNISVTARNLDSVMPELVSLVQQVAERQGVPCRAVLSSSPWPGCRAPASISPEPRKGPPSRPRWSSRSTTRPSTPSNANTRRRRPTRSNRAANRSCAHSRWTSGP